MTLEAERRLHQRPDLVGEEAGVLVEALQLQAVAALQLGFVVPGIDVAGAAVDEQPDDRLGPGGEMAGPRCQGVQLALVVGAQPLALQEAGQGEGAEPHAGATQEIAA